MNNFVKILLMIGLTALCAFLGYFAVAFIQEMTVEDYIETGGGGFSYQSNQPSQHKAESPSIDDINVGEEGDENMDILPVPRGGSSSSSRKSVDSYLEIIAVSKPVYHETNKKYSFTVTADGEVVEYHLCDSHGKELYSQTSPDFLVSPSYSGKYIVYAMNDSAISEDVEVTGCYRMEEKLLKSDLQSAFNSGDYQAGDSNSFKTRISSKCAYRFSGIREGEEAPVSYSEIFNRISMGVWSSVTVDALEYDSHNRVSKMAITVNY